MIALTFQASDLEQESQSFLKWAIRTFETMNPNSRTQTDLTQQISYVVCEAIEIQSFGPQRWCCCYLEEEIWPLGKLGRKRLMHMCIKHVSMPLFCATIALLEKGKLSKNSGAL